MVVIVGAGVAGLSVAWALAREGVRVVVLEAGRVAGAASWAAAGYLQPTLDGDATTDLEWDSLARWPAFAAALEAESGVDVDFRTSGQLRIAHDDSEAEVRADAARRVAAGWRVELLEGRALREREPALSDAVVCAAFLPQVSWVDGRKLCTALRIAVERRGGRVVEGARVDRVVRSGGGVTGVATTAATYAGDAVVLATGCGSGPIGGLPGDWPAIEPVKGVILTLGAPGDPPLLGHLVKHPEGILCPRNDGRLIAGVTRERGNLAPGPEAGAVMRILSAAVRAVPACAGLTLLETVVGFRSFVPGERPLVGPSAATGLWYSLGHGADGYLRAPALSLRLAQAILYHGTVQSVPS